MSVSELELDLGTAAMICTAEELAAAMASFLREMRSVAGLLRPDERVALRMIMSRETGTLTVGEVFRGFARDSEAHKTLRRLRAAQFVRPAKSGHWAPEVRIEVKPFARLIWDRVGEGTIFADDSADVVLTGEEDLPMAEPVAPPQPPPTVVPKAAQPGTIQPEAVPTDEVDVEQVAASVWEDDAVVDLAAFDDLQAYAEEELRGKR
jgi:hypothetical protein